MIALHRRWLAILIICQAAHSLGADSSPESIEWRAQLNAAEQLESSGNLEAAEREFDLALGSARQIRPETAAVAEVLNAMGRYYDLVGNFSEAERRFSQSFGMWRRLLGPDHPALIRVIAWLASVYLETHQLAKAEKLGLEAWADRLERSDPTSTDLLRVLEDLAALRSQRGQFSEAEATYQQAFDIAARQGNEAETAVLLNNLGLTCLAYQKYNSAVDYLSRSLAAWQRLRDPDSPNAAVTGQALARAYEALGRYKEADPLLTHALAVAEHTFGPRSVRTAAILQTYAECLRHQGQKKEAKTAEARAQSILRGAGPAIASRSVVDVGELSLRQRE